MSRMTSSEFTESLAFERLEPDPAEVTMHLTARLLTLMANVHRDADRKPTPFEVEDFLPNPYALPRAERQAQHMATMAAFAANRKARTH